MLKKFFNLFLICNIFFIFPAIANAEIEPIEITTKSGINAVLVQDKTTDYVSVNLAFKDSGSISDPANKSGRAFLAMEMLQRSEIEGNSRHERVRKLKEMGILSGIELSVSHDDLYIYLKAPKENFNSALNEVKKILTFRDFDINDLNNLKSYIPAGSQINKTDEVAFATRTLMSIAFQNHPYGAPVNGTYEDIQSITKSDLIKYMDNSFAKENLIISVVGNINKKDLIKEIENNFNFLPKEPKLKKVEDPKLNLSNITTYIFKDTPQSGVAFIQPGVKFNDKDFYALSATINILIGDTFTSRLWNETREKRGLVYDIGAGLSTELNKAGIIIGWFKSDNKNVDEIINIIKHEWKKMKNNGITQSEYENAITGLIGSYALNFITPQDISSYLLFLKLKGLNPSYIKQRNEKIKSLSIDDINNAAKKYLDPDKLKFVVVGKNI